VEVKRTAVCTICESEFKSGGTPPRHKCGPKFDNQTGTGMYLDDIGEITTVPEIVEGDVEIEIPVSSEPPLTIEVPPPDPSSGEPIRGPQAPKSSKKDVNKIDDLVHCFAAALDNEKYSPDEKTAIIAQLFADTVDVRVETSQLVISQLNYGVISLVGVLLLLNKERLKPAFQNYRKMFDRQPDKGDPFGDS